MKYKIGDRVIGTEKSIKWSSTLYGLKGTIIGVSYNVYDVEFDKKCYGHSCSGRGKYGYCWNLTEDEIQPLIENEILNYEIY